MEVTGALPWARLYPNTRSAYQKLAIGSAPLPTGETGELLGKDVTRVRVSDCLVTQTSDHELVPKTDGCGRYKVIYQSK